MPRQHCQDGRHGEHVGHAMPLDQPPRFLAIQPLAGQQHASRRRAPPAASAWMPAPCDSGATTSETSVLRRAGHQVAQMVADDVFHLPMRQHAGLRPPRGAGGIEEPRRMVAIDIGRRARSACRTSASVSHVSSPSPIETCSRARGIFRPRRRRMLGERGIEDMHRRAGGLRQICHLRRRQPEIGRHPHRAQHPRREHRLEHRVGIARVQQHPIAMPHAARRQRAGRAPARARRTPPRSTRGRAR